MCARIVHSMHTLIRKDGVLMAVQKYIQPPSSASSSNDMNVPKECAAIITDIGTVRAQRKSLGSDSELWNVNLHY